MCVHQSIVAARFTKRQVKRIGEDLAAVVDISQYSLRWNRRSLVLDTKNVAPCTVRVIVQNAPRILAR